MLLYLVRHAHAVSEEEDSTRPLSSRGVADTRRLAEFFRTNRAFAPAQLWHSPLRRSRETATILADELKLDRALVETSDLRPDDDPEEIAKRIAAFSADQPAIAIVGHEPHHSALATLHVRGKTRPASIVMKKAAVLALERTDETHRKSGEPRWLVAWHLSPALLPNPSPATKTAPVAP